MFDVQVTPEVADAIAEIGRVDPRYHSPEGKLFRDALKLIETKDRWCQGSYFTADGQKHCSTGALYRQGSVDGMAAVRRELGRFMDNQIIGYNDSHTHAEVVLAWRRAGLANGWL